MGENKTAMDYPKIDRRSESILPEIFFKVLYDVFVTLVASTEIGKTHHRSQKRVQGKGLTLLCRSHSS
jgi:hypothetical protein